MSTVAVSTGSTVSTVVSTAGTKPRIRIQNADRDCVIVLTAEKNSLNFQTFSHRAVRASAGYVDLILSKRAQWQVSAHAILVEKADSLLELIQLPAGLVAGTDRKYL